MRTPPPRAAKDLARRREPVQGKGGAAARGLPTKERIVDHSVRNAPALSGSAPDDQRVAWLGARRDFFRLLARGALYELFTVGFYRFWLVTDMRRYLWTHIGAGGDTLEYTGRARELLIGFLIALAILGPAYLVYFLIGLVAESLQVLASLPLVALFYLFGYFASYRARRYRLTRTVWRGLRFWMTGSAWAYMARGLFWDIALVLTLTFALPWRDAALERYKMRHTHYGDLRGDFTATGGALFREAWWLWALAPIALVLVVPLPFLYASFRARQWRWWMSGLRLGDVRFASDLPSGALHKIYWAALGWALLLLVVFGALAAGLIGGAMAAYGTQDLMAVTRRPAIAIAIIVAYVMVIFGMNVVMRLYLTHDVWRRVAQSVTVSGLHTAADVAARGEAADAIGEGLSDGLDVGGF